MGRQGAHSLRNREIISVRPFGFRAILLLILAAMGIVVVVFAWYPPTLERLVGPRDLQVGQLLVLTILATITAFYAQRVNRLARASREQLRATERAAQAAADVAEAAYKLAQESEAARLRTFMPVLALQLGGITRGAGEADLPAELHVTIRNVGSGPALNVALTVHPAWYEFSRQAFGVLGVGMDWDMTLQQQRREGTPGGAETVTPALLANYQDIFGNPYASQLFLRQSKAGDWEEDRFELLEPPKLKEG